VRLSNARDAALSRVIRHRLEAREPEAAFELALLLNDSGQQKRELGKTFLRWHEQNPSAAKRAVSLDHRLEESTRAELLRLPEQ